ncbi:MAG: diguanylate cyclase [Eubacterium sp.]|nr:diguanylate cyclase [Eubacterium sp.]
MFVLSMDVLYKLNNTDIIGMLKDLPLPNEVECTWKEAGDAESFVMPQDRYVVIITDDIKLIGKAGEYPDFSMIVYCGKVTEDTPYLDKIDQLWLFRNEEYIKHNFLKLIKALKDEYDGIMHTNTAAMLVDSCPDMIWIKDLNGIHLNVNKHFCEVVGKTKEDCRGKTHEYIWDVSEDTDYSELVCVKSEDEVIKAGKTLVFEELVQIGDNMKQLMTYKSPIKDMFGNTIGTCGIGHDITDLNNMGLEFSILLENIPLPVLLCDADFKTIRMNANFKDMVDLSAEEISDFDYRIWREKNLKVIDEPNVDSKRHSISFECKRIGKGKEAYFTIIEQEIYDYIGNLTGYYCVFSDTTLRHYYEQSLINAANIDTLTELFNRRYFYEYMISHKGNPMTLLYIDLDNFKMVNDRLGHSEGDEILKKSAGLIKDIFDDGLCVRLGGDEFAVILVGEYSGNSVNERCIILDKAISDLIQGQNFCISASIGMVQTDGKEVDIDAFVHEGDVSMYEIKRNRHAGDKS